jgi:hypothetical protein
MREEVAGGWKRLHNKEHNDLYTSPSTKRVIKSRRMRWAGHIICKGEARNAYIIFVGKPGLKRPLVRNNRRWRDNVRMDFR